jgi:hypothetical protein
MTRHRLSNIAKLYWPQVVTIITVLGSALMIYTRLIDDVSAHGLKIETQDTSIRRMEFNLSNFMSQLGYKYDWDAGGR